MLIFKSADVLRCVRHALASSKWEMGYEEKEQTPGLQLVHDNGVYIMSNGIPRDYIPDEERCYVAYAQGCDPKNDEDFYETSRDLVGGDDFVEVLSIDKNWLSIISKYNEIQIEITPQELNIEFSSPIERDS